MVLARDATAHVAVIAIIAAGYILVRVVMEPAGGLLRGHATDLLAGVALPSLFALVFQARGEMGEWVRSLPGKLALTASAAVVWEVIVPLFDPRSTADWLDALAYVVGTVVQHVFVGRVSRHIEAPR